jgi:putative membrane protein
VKDFGAMMVTDHTAANDKLIAVAAAKQVTLPDAQV